MARASLLSYCWALWIGSGVHDETIEYPPMTALSI